MRNDKRLKLYNWYETRIERWIPSYALLSLIGCLVWNCLIYWGTQQTILGLGLRTHDITSPTTNVRPDIDGSGILDSLMGLIYFLDPPLDLFPSIHCLVSLLSWLGIRKCSNIPQWYRNSTLIFAVMIFASTQFTKQHYLADVIAGIVIALGCYFISRHCSGYKAVERFFGRMSSKLFGDETEVHDVEK